MPPFLLSSNVINEQSSLFLSCSNALVHMPKFVHVCCSMCTFPASISVSVHMCVYDLRLVRLRLVCPYIVTTALIIYLLHSELGWFSELR
ncbi:hypothetical protein F5879DRAFT_433816 [Lentinula edodes]|nr:hypothetical protein F5879DRAFT_433816 [Lentinula edodes]